jgi:transposase
MWLVQGGLRQGSRQSCDQSPSCQSSSARQDQADIENQIRGLLKNLGLVVERAKMNVFTVRAAQLAEDRSELFAAVDPLPKARAAVEQQIADLDRKALRLARNNAQVRRFMTAPGVGPVTALCFLPTIDDPLASRGHEASELTQG